MQITIRTRLSYHAFAGLACHLMTGTPEGSHAELLHTLLTETLPVALSKLPASNTNDELILMHEVPESFQLLVTREKEPDHQKRGLQIVPNKFQIELTPIIRSKIGLSGMLDVSGESYLPNINGLTLQPRLSFKPDCMPAWAVLETLVLTKQVLDLSGEQPCHVLCGGTTTISDRNVTFAQLVARFAKTWARTVSPR